MAGKLDRLYAADWKMINKHQFSLPSPDGFGSSAGSALHDA
jgi:hypothetical protein